MKQANRITVLMPVYNAEKYLKEAIESILSQTIRDFDFLIIDDGSSDNSINIIESYDDSRIKFYKNTKNMGIVKTLNRGISLTNTDYICRMDSDDIAYNNRLEKQLEYMDSNPNILVSGTSILKFNDAGWEKRLSVRTNPQQIRSHLLFANALMHPTVIIRTSALKKWQLDYNEKHIAMEDYGLWQKLALKGDIGNVNQVLLRYRDNELGISNQAKKDTKARDEAYKIIYNHYFELLNIQLTESQLKIYREFVSGKGKMWDSNWLKDLKKILESIYRAIDKIEFDSNYLRVKWGQIFRINVLNNNISLKSGAKIYKQYYAHIFNFSFIEKLKLILQSNIYYV